MRLLLDECVVHDLKRDFHAVTTAVEAGFGTKIEDIIQPENQIQIGNQLQIGGLACEFCDFSIVFLRFRVDDALREMVEFGVQL